MVQLFSIKEVRSVVVKNKYQAKVLDVSVLINNCTSKITAWNILAELLFFLLAGKEVKLKNKLRLKIKGCNNQITKCNNKKRIWKRTLCF